MKTIYKYKLEFVEEQTLMIPALELQKLKLETIDNIPHLWCVVDTNVEPRPYHIRFVGTGHEMLNLDLQNYLGSINVKSGRKNYVWHYFQVAKDE